MNIRLSAELAMAVSLAVVLDLLSKTLPIPRLPYGGSVSLRTLPLLAVALRRGTRAGATAGIAYGVVDFLLGPHYLHPVQALLDYPVAFGGLGMAGLVTGWGTQGWRSRLALVAGVLLGSSARFLVHFASGVVFFASFAPPGQPVWLYSLLYNAFYIVPETIISILLLQLVLRHLGSHHECAG